MYADSYLKGENETLRGNEKNEEGSLKRDGGNKTDESKNPHHKQTRHITIGSPEVEVDKDQPVSSSCGPSPQRL
jgi:hypothetical protein